MEVIVDSAKEKAFLDLLFAGFLMVKSNIQDACTDALHDWGVQIGSEHVVPQLQHFAEKTKSRSLRMRALLLADRIKSGCPAEHGVSAQDLLLMCLTANSPLLHEKAYGAAAYLPDMCDDLISAAVDSRKNAARCVRFLKAAKATGSKPSGEEWLNLFFLLQTTKQLAVRSAAAELLQLRPR